MKIIIVILFIATTSVFSQKIQFGEPLKPKPESEKIFDVKIYKTALLKNQQNIINESPSINIKREIYMPTKNSPNELVNTLQQVINKVPVSKSGFQFGLFPTFNENDTYIISKIIGDTVIIKIISSDKLINRYFDNLHLFFISKSRQLVKIKAIMHVYEFQGFAGEPVQSIINEADYTLYWELKDEGINMPKKCVYFYPNKNLFKKKINWDKYTKEIIYYD